MSVYHIVRDEQGYAKAVDRGDGYYLLHLTAGTVRNEENIDRIVTELNELDALRSEVERLRAALRPFAHFAEWADEDARWVFSRGSEYRDINWKHLSQARAALEEKHG